MPNAQCAGVRKIGSRTKSQLPETAIEPGIIELAHAIDQSQFVAAQKRVSRIWRARRPHCQDFQEHSWSDAMSNIEFDIRDSCPY
jgi:hypothetical protein